MAATGAELATVAFLDIDTVPRPMHISSLRGINKVNELLVNNNEAGMYKNVRMGPRCFIVLCDILIERRLLQPSHNMNVPEQLFVFLTIACQSQTNREVQDIWQLMGRQFHGGLLMSSTLYMHYTMTLLNSLTMTKCMFFYVGIGKDMVHGLMIV